MAVGLEASVWTYSNTEEIDTDASGYISPDEILEHTTNAAVCLRHVGRVIRFREWKRSSFSAGGPGMDKLRLRQEFFETIDVHPDEARVKTDLEHILSPTV